MTVTTAVTTIGTIPTRKMAMTKLRPCQVDFDLTVFGYMSMVFTEKMKTRDPDNLTNADHAVLEMLRNVDYFILKNNEEFMNRFTNCLKCYDLY